MEAVTGRLPPAEREERIASLSADGGKFVLVCTDCLSEGINLQEHFDAVLHYDLAWNPTRHEQREGRVDRFGQKAPEVRVVTYYGTDNPIDGVILDVLIRKHKSIKSDLGVTVAVPGSSEQIAEALFEGALFRDQEGAGQLSLDFIDSLDSKKQDLHVEWENARDREKASRSRFAQHSIKPGAVAGELEAVRAAIGRSADVARFFLDVLRTANVPVQLNGRAEAGISKETPRSLRQAIGKDEPFTGRFDLPLQEGEIYLGRHEPRRRRLGELDPGSGARSGLPRHRCRGRPLRGALNLGRNRADRTAGHPLPLSPEKWRSRGRDHPVRGNRAAGVRRSGRGAPMALSRGKRGSAGRPARAQPLPHGHRPAARSAASRVVELAGRLGKPG